MIPPDATPHERRWIYANMVGQRERRAGDWPPVQAVFRKALGLDQDEEVEQR